MIEPLPRLPKELLDDKFAFVEPSHIDKLHATINELISQSNDLEERVKRLEDNLLYDCNTEYICLIHRRPPTLN